MVVGGVGMFIGSAFRNLCFDDSLGGGCNSSRGDGVAAIGVVSTLVGTLGVVGSGIVLGKAKRKKSKILRGQSAPELSVNPTGASFKMQF